MTTPFNEPAPVYTGMPATINVYLDTILRMSYSGIIGTDIPDPTFFTPYTGLNVTNASSDTVGLHFDNYKVPAIGLTETFTGTPGTELSAYDSNWSLDFVTGNGNQGIISTSQRLRHDDTIPTNDGVYYQYQVAPANPFHYVEVDFVVTASTGPTYKGGPLMWYSSIPSAGSPPPNYILARYARFVMGWQLFTQVNGTFNTRDFYSDPGFTPGNTKVMRLEVTTP